MYSFYVLSIIHYIMNYLFYCLGENIKIPIRNRGGEGGSWLYVDFHTFFLSHKDVDAFFVALFLVDLYPIVKYQKRSFLTLEIDPFWTENLQFGPKTFKIDPFWTENLQFRPKDWPFLDRKPSKSTLFGPKTFNLDRNRPSNGEND